MLIASTDMKKGRNTNSLHFICYIILTQLGLLSRRFKHFTIIPIVHAVCEISTAECGTNHLEHMINSLIHSLPVARNSELLHFVPTCSQSADATAAMFLLSNQQTFTLTCIRKLRILIDLAVSVLSRAIAESPPARIYSHV